MLRFIVCGWHYNQSSLIEGLAELQKENPNDVHVFWSCHREPTDFIKENFDYKVFFNGGEEYGAYEQAINHLNIADEDVCFFMHDDLVISEWGFIEKIVTSLTTNYIQTNRGMKKAKIIGNGINHRVENYDYNKVIDIGVKKEFDGMRLVDYVKEENKHLFDKPIPKLITVRPSFISMLYSTVKEIGGFEPRYDAYVSPKLMYVKDDGIDEYEYRGGKKLSSWGNDFPNLNNYKFNRLYDTKTIGFLSEEYLHSKYIHECIRGKFRWT
tara:strand:+ start:47 stop:850 length:804 start_codon:yes stop_codon:yes gene_type:complete